ncbi:queuosine precursor transporter [Maricaulis parjimensis]|uniref:queuosine precursor transporter n=1 Tax=Maricaulis parjimensis TaxID=144023 RepID=UPI00193A404A|nr:queuosine precursor transporter [Maricaulis parjimensis]
MDPSVDAAMHPEKVTRKAFVLFFCTGLFMVSLVLAALTAIKVHEVQLGPIAVLVPAGTVAFGLTYLATDVISEVWGRGYALCVVLTGVAMRFLVAFLLVYAMHVEDVVPFMTPAESWTAERQAEFVSVFASGNRTNFAGLVAFGLSALADVLIFHHLRVRDEGKNRLWLRNNISTIVSQILNSTIFISVAFAGIFSWAAIGSLILGQVIFKISVAVLDTPIVYLLRNIAEGRSLTDMRG